MSEAKRGIPAAMLDAATAAMLTRAGYNEFDYPEVHQPTHARWIAARKDATAILEAAGVVTMAERIAQLEAELAEYQESSFHPDWPLLDATRESLREAQARIAELEALNNNAVAALAGGGRYVTSEGVADAIDSLWVTLRERDEKWGSACRRIAELEKQLAADTLIARLSEDDELWQRFERAFLDRFADEPNIVRECLLATPEVKAEIAWQSINQAQGGASE